MYTSSSCALSYLQYKAFWLAVFFYANPLLLIYTHYCGTQQESKTRAGIVLTVKPCPCSCATCQTMLHRINTELSHFFKYFLTYHNHAY